MKVNPAIKRWHLPLLWISRILLVIFVVAIFMGANFPFASGDKSNFIALIHIGVAVGIVSNWRFIIGLNWKDPINIIGSLLGIAATLVIVFAVKDKKIPFISGYATAFQALGVLLVIKIGLKILQDKKAKIPDSVP
jgi:hypothetical protein